MYMYYRHSTCTCTCGLLEAIVSTKTFYTTAQISVLMVSGRLSEHDQVYDNITCIQRHRLLYEIVNLCGAL